MFARRLWRSFDLVLLVAAILLMVYGVAMIGSATRGTEDMAHLWQRQAVYAVSGLCLLLLIAAFDYRFYENLHRPLYIFIIVALIGVFVVGEISQGVQRWIGANAIQPSELAKVILIIGLAKILSDHDGEMTRLCAAADVVDIPSAKLEHFPDAGFHLGGYGLDGGSAPGASGAASSGRRDRQPPRLAHPQGLHA